MTRKRFIKLLMGRFGLDRAAAVYVAGLVRIDPLTRTYAAAWEDITSWPPRWRRGVPGTMVPAPNRRRDL